MSRDEEESGKPNQQVKYTEHSDSNVVFLCLDDSSHGTQIEEPRLLHTIVTVE